jgi:sulfatase maturation enzyme AslB (radical SAM superfamily)
MHLEIDPAENVRPCCVYKGTVGNTNDSTLNALFNSTTMQSLRQELAAGQKPSGCSTCWTSEQQGFVSNRLRHLSFLKSELIDSFTNPVITSLDIKPGSVCNFKCRICNSASSSAHAEEQHRYRMIPLKIYNWDQKSTALDQVSSILDSLTNIDMYGGEPFLVKSLTQLIRDAIDKKYADKIRLHYNSNGSIWPGHLIPLWPHFKHVDIHFSIDSIGEKFELERGGSWSTVELNIRRLIDLKLPNLSISIMPSVNIMNVYYLNDVYSWASQLGLPVRLNYVREPAALSIENLTEKSKELIISLYQDSQQPDLRNIAQMVQNSVASNGNDFQKLIKEYDHMRLEDFTVTHSEIASAMGYNHNT